MVEVSEQKLWAILASTYKSQIALLFIDLLLKKYKNCTKFFKILSFVSRIVGKINFFLSFFL